VQRIGNELGHIVEHERCQHDLLHPPAGLADHIQSPRERMRDIDLVAPVSAHQQEVPHVRIGDQMLEQFEGRSVQPLQIVEKQRERVLRPGEHAKESPEHELEAVVRILQQDVGNRRRLAYDDNKLRD
jgi:hypothetical protein